MKNDVLYGQLYRKYDMVGADNRKREMVCLPEQFIYGWICSLNSQSKEFLEYKVMCHNILYNYFKGTIVGRKKLLQRKNDIEKEIEQTEKELINNPAYQKIKELKKEQTQILKNLKNNDKQALENSPQLNFF
ncbi:hypothetical protein RCZ15_04070 [Capnocytophaga catalasegens]|uniref:Uncharacterized protein n=2 Tax=Capnocytophaga catalasegens TaxID=1004260 RepID=A0AAV5AXJ5_9FLAO|nr:hypothetical protein RCZ03_10520 [Capnocytophaga catalasegens]GJM49432.1 hypothetical protein RCZ15_04070 [Capnocytophaga catalasegens]GJM52582.1 hypothetical protein RCZ16_08990 [Capnocytophaga catalasegens]